MTIAEFLGLTSTQVSSPVFLFRVISGSLSVPSWKSWYDSPFAPHSASGAHTWDNVMLCQTVILSSPDWNCNMLATMWIVIVLFLRTHSFSWATFSTTLFSLMDTLNFHNFEQRSYGFWTWKTTQEITYFPLSAVQKLFSLLQKYL
jgi:hypothetical protein